SIALLDEAIELAHRGSYVDMDTVEDGLGEWLRYYADHGGSPSQLTVSSDAQTANAWPGKLHRAFVRAVREDGLELDAILPYFTRNPAAALHLRGKGWIRAGADADILLLERETLSVRHVVAMGNVIVEDGAFRPLGAEAGGGGSD